MKTSATLCSALLLALAPCDAQVIIRGGIRGGGQGIIGGGQVIINGGRLIIEGAEIEGEGDADPENGGQKSDASTAAEQVLEFADGSRLHGTLEKIDGVKKEIIWRGVDSSAPLTFPLGQVSHWAMSAKAKTDVKVRATVKLTGGDWLAGDLTDLAKDKLHLMLGDGTALTVDRAHVEWIYFSKSAVECYDGPLSLSGWVSDGSWTYREGALRAARPTVLGRMFEALPDQVEYRFDFYQGAGIRSFAILLHGTDAAARGFGPGMVRLMVSDTQLHLWSQMENNMKQEQVDFSKVLPALAPAADGSVRIPKKPTCWRIFEDRPGGRLIVFIDGHKVADWKLDKVKVGENRGGFSLQPMSWNGANEQSLAKIKVVPWDGFVPVDDALDGVRPKTDQVVLEDGDRNAGRIESVTADKVQIGTTGVAREKVVLMRFARPANPPDEDPPVARVRLAHRGEFEVVAFGFQEGKLRVRTNFGGELMLSATEVRGLDFAHLTPLEGKLADLLLFKNGDQLRGQLDAAASGQKIRWQTAPTTPPVELDTARLAGVVIAPRAVWPEGRNGVLARCRNGDLLAGDLVVLDKKQLALEGGAAGALAVPRAQVQALYFSHEGKLPVLDGAAEHQVWEAGLDLNRGINGLQQVRPARPEKPAGGAPPASRWSYFDGQFAVKRTSTHGRNDGNPTISLGRLIEAMPARVEFSFDVIGKANQVIFSSQLFAEPGKPGYMLQLHQGGLFIYDTDGQMRGRAMQQQVQVQFGEKVKANAARHRIRILADRPSGRMTVLVDDVNVASFGPKAGSPPRNLGRGLSLIPQPNLSVSFANLWVAPWNGRLPGAASSGVAPPSDSVLLANGDETQGAIGTATPEVLRIESEVGPLEVPVSRLTMVEFEGSPAESPNGVRLRLRDGSLLTVGAYRIEKETMICQSPVVGEIKMPLAAVQEIVFGRRLPVPPAKAEEKPTAARPVIQGGAVQILIEN